ncbi:MAG TPA: cytochrome P450 [Acidimicrobiales bacterium]
MTATSTSSDLFYDPYERSTALDPHPLLARMREEAPIYHNEELGFYAVTRYDDVERVLVAREQFISSRGATLNVLLADMQLPPGTLVMDDPPIHTIYRGLMSRMFTARRVSGLEDSIRAYCAELLDPLVGTGGFDLVRNLGAPVPFKVISLLVGIPEDDKEFVRGRLESFHTDEITVDEILGGSVFGDFIDWRVEHPSDDIMTTLMNVDFTDETGTERRLTREELLANINNVTLAGLDTTKRLIGWAGKILAEHPEQRRALVEDPSLIPNAVDELLRYEPPMLQLCRYVASDAEFHGVTVPEGSPLLAITTAANRDPAHFEAPNHFDVRRTGAHHFSLGFGTHYCLGQALARLEARVMLEELLARFPEWDIDEEGAVFTHDDLRGWASLPIVTP